jgi:phospholipid/cholesterol/gamma-HCH transport system ATP-binding protein
VLKITVILYKLLNFISLNPLADKISVKNLTMSYGKTIVMNDISFNVKAGEIFLIIGESGCGKSTLLKHMIGLKPTNQGVVFYDGADFINILNDSDKPLATRFGVLYQSGALWSSMTLVENIALVLEEFTNLTKSEIKEAVNMKLSLVGLENHGHLYPSEISGGMRKRAGLARAIALNPDILFLDEPSAGLDPISANNLDNLILKLRKTLGTTMLIVTHDLHSIFAIGDNAMYLDADSKTVLAIGSPNQLLENFHTKVKYFLSRGMLNDK